MTGVVAAAAVVIAFDWRGAAREEGLGTECLLTPHPDGTTIDYRKIGGRWACVYRNRSRETVLVTPPNPTP